MFDVIDEKLIAASPAAVFQELVAMGRGDADWVRPYLKVTPLSGDPSEVGARMAVAVRSGPRFTARVDELIRDRLIHFVYDGGAFRGHGRWTIEPAGESTRIRLHWQTTPQGLWRLLGRLVSIPKEHSRVIQAGFDALEKKLTVHARGYNSDVAV